MDKTITTALLIIISMVMALLLFNAAYPAVIEGSDAISAMAQQSEDRIRSHVTLVHVAAELDSAGWWQDTNTNSRFDVFVWVKNTGLTRITALDSMDVFFGAEGNFMRIPHESQAGGNFPNWSWAVENATDWQPSATLRIEIHHANPLSSGRYFVRIVTPNGLSVDEVVGL